MTQDQRVPGRKGGVAEWFGATKYTGGAMAGKGMGWGGGYFALARSRLPLFMSVR